MVSRYYSPLLNATKSNWVVWALMASFLSCEGKLTPQHEPFPIIVDVEDSHNLDIESAYSPFYIGPMKDTVIVNHYITYLYEYDSVPAEFLPNYYQTQLKDILVPNPYTNYQQSFDSDKIESTNKFIDYPIFKAKHVIFSVDFNQSVDRNGKKTIPISVKNISSQTLSLESDSYLPFKMQALDSNNNWHYIEKPFFRQRCTSSGNMLILPPNYLVFTSFSIPQGDYQTRLRLKFGRVATESVQGSINYDQFK